MKVPLISCCTPVTLKPGRIGSLTAVTVSTGWPDPFDGKGVNGSVGTLPQAIVGHAAIHACQRLGAEIGTIN